MYNPKAFTGNRVDTNRHIHTPGRGRIMQRMTGGTKAHEEGGWCAAPP